MVVVAVIALLLAVVMPSMTSVLAMGRATICRNNLHNLAAAFVASAHARIPAGDSGTTGGDFALIYPQAMQWPGIPSDAVPEMAMYECPDDITKRSLAECLKKLEYRCPYGYYPMDTMEGYGPAGGSLWYLARRGSDSLGAYTEYLLEDDPGTPTSGQLSQLNFHGWVDTDGAVRVYDIGKVLIFDSIPTTPDWSGAHCPGAMNSCGDLNAIYFEGKPAFGTDGQVKYHRGKIYDIPGWDAGETNYGINSYAYMQNWGSKSIVLVDYKELIVDIDDAVKTEDLLIKSGRHLGRVNYLTGDGAVHTAMPLSLSPRLAREKWVP